MASGGILKKPAGIVIYGTVAVVLVMGYQTASSIDNKVFHTGGQAVHVLKNSGPEFYKGYNEVPDVAAPASPVTPAPPAAAAPAPKAKAAPSKGKTPAVAGANFLTFPKR